MRLADRLRRLLSHRRLPLVLAAGAMALCAPSLPLGLHLDDHVLQAALMRPSPFPEASRSLADLFAFFPGSADSTRRALDRGVLPWWTSPTFRAAFFRPLSGLTHWLDFRLWPGHEAAQPGFDIRHLFQLLDRLYRDASPMRRGERLELTGVTVEVEAVTPAGRPG